MNGFESKRNKPEQKISNILLILERSLKDEFQKKQFESQLMENFFLVVFVGELFE